MEVTCAKETHLTRWRLYPERHHTKFKSFDPVETPDVKMEGRTYRPESWKIMCPDCGAIWASRENVDLPNNNWQVKRWPCQACGHGSLWDAWNKPWNRSLPYELLIREMTLIKGWYDMGIKTYREYFQYKHFRRKV